MKTFLATKPKGPVIINGFLGAGMVGTITTEYLIKHLNAKPIGYMKSDEMPPMAAIHEGKLIQPLEIYYSKKYNVIILHALADTHGLEWDIVDEMLNLYKILGAKEIISIEGIMGKSGKDNIFFYSNDPKKKCPKVKPLEEGIIMGVTAALLLRVGKKAKVSGFFAETEMKLPDSKAAADIILALDNYLNFKIDPKPLLKAAAEFEEKLKGFIAKSQKASEHHKGKPMPYMG